MSIRLGSVVFASMFTVFGLLVACSDDNTGTTGGTSSGASSSSGSSGSSGSNGSSGDNGSSGGAADKCEIPPGKYTVKYTTKPGGTGPAGQPCQDLPESEIEVKEDSDADGGSGTPEPQEGCTVDTNEAECTVSVNCENTNSGFTTTTQFVTTTKDGAVKGSTSSKTVKDDDGSVVSDCSYEFEWTKK